MIGESLNMAGKLLGHKRPKTTEIYSHLSADQISDAADRVSATLADWLKSG
jgi:site-specific recombinase XerD